MADQLKMRRSVASVIKEQEDLRIELELYKKYLEKLQKEYSRDSKYQAYKNTEEFLKKTISSIEYRLGKIDDALYAAEVNL